MLRGGLVASSSSQWPDHLQFLHGQPKGDQPAVDAMCPHEIVRGAVVISQTHRRVSHPEKNMAVSLRLAWNIEDLSASADDL